jgi:flagellar biosynthetic protein FliR
MAPQGLADILLALPTYALVLFRIAGLVVAAPLFSSRVVPVRIRAGLAMLVGLLMLPIAQRQVPPQLTLDVALIGAVGEFMVGVTIGLALAILLMGGEAAGLVVGQQAGLALADVFDPTRNQPGSVIGQVYVIVITTLFLMVGGHRAAMAALLDTYKVIPVLSFGWNESFLLLLVEMMAAAFVLGIRLAGPVLVALLLMEIALAFLSRTMPQFNILSVGFSLRLLLGLAVAAVAVMAAGDGIADAITEAVASIRAAFGLAPTPTHLVY